MGFSLEFNAHVNGKSLLKTVIQAFVCCSFEVELMGETLDLNKLKAGHTGDTEFTELWESVCKCMSVCDLNPCDSL